MRQGLFLRRTPFVIVSLVIATLACTVTLNPKSAALPSVSIESPIAGASVPVDQPLTIQIAASDLNGPGVTRVDLQVNGDTVGSLAPPTATLNFTGEMVYTPDTEGAISISVIAYRADGTASPPANVAVQVVGMSTALPTEETTAETTGDVTDVSITNTSGATATTGSTVVRVQARADLDLNVRARPGPGCDIIGVWEGGETGFLYERTTGLDYWYQTDVLGPGTEGWVFHGDLTLLESDDKLPRVEEEGCLYCGDGVCSASEGEFCNTCETDCGACCGDGVCTEAHGEACDVCVSDCGVCPFCGDGVVNQDSEQCDGGGCGTGESCTNCQCQVICGDGVCAPQSKGENCYVCATDCGACCGNGTCDGVYGESSATCPADCPAISDVNQKEDFEAVDDRAVLERLMDIPVTTWSYIFDEDGTRHMGPMAQDFYDAFGLGGSDETINLLDANGVTLAALKGMYAITEQNGAQIDAQQAQIDALEARMAALENERRWRMPVGWVAIIAMGVFAAGLWFGRHQRRTS